MTMSLRTSKLFVTTIKIQKLEALHKKAADPWQSSHGMVGGTGVQWLETLKPFASQIHTNPAWSGLALSVSFRGTLTTIGNFQIQSFASLFTLFYCWVVVFFNQTVSITAM